MLDYELSLHVNLETKRKMALAMYRIVTIGSFDFVYGNLELDEDQAQKIKYKMETRVQFYLCKMTGISWDNIRGIKELDLTSCQRIIATLSVATYDTVRNWWHSTGSETFYKEKDERKQQERLDALAIVFRLDDNGFAKQTEAGGYTVVQKPQDATGWAHECDIASLEQFFNKHYSTVKPIVLNKEAVGNVIEGE